MASETRWDTWVKRGEDQDIAMRRKWRFTSVVLAVMLVVGYVVYLAVR